MNKLLLTIMILCTCAFAGEKKYEDVKLVEVYTKQDSSTVATHDSKGRYTGQSTYTVENPVFVIQQNNTQYEGECSFTVWRRFSPADFVVGTEIQVRFNEKKSKFWVRSTKGKENQCEITKQSAIRG